MVHTTHTRNGPIYWILLPGDREAHALDATQARKLFRELEAAV